METSDRIFRTLFFLYFGAVVTYGLYAWFLGFLGDDMTIIDPYEGRAEMYLDYMHE